MGPRGGEAGRDQNSQGPSDAGPTEAKDGRKSKGPVVSGVGAISESKLRTRGGLDGDRTSTHSGEDRGECEGGAGLAA